MHAVVKPLKRERKLPTGKNPFVGPDPIPGGSELFGRDGEREEVVDMLIAERFVLLFGATGTGKTSIVSAGVVADCENHGINCLPIVKLAAYESRPGINPFLASAYLQLFPEEEENFQQFEGDLLEALDEKLESYGSDRVLIVIDTLEQLFTHSARKDATVAEFLDALEILHCEHRGLMLLVVMREEFIGRLEGVARPLRAGARMRLAALPGDRALEAIARTADGENVVLPDEYLAPIVRQLARFSEVRSTTGTAIANDTALAGVPLEELMVEPVYLQLTCYRNWEVLKADAARIASGVPLTNLASVSVGDTIDEYVESAITETLDELKDTNPRRLREFLARVLVEENGELGSVRADEAEKSGISRELLQRLEQRKLIRCEPHGRRNEYELSHYLIAQAVRRQYNAWCLTNLHPFQIRGQSFSKSGHASLLLNKRELEEAHAWLSKHPATRGKSDDAIIEESQKALAAKRRDWTRIAWMVALGVLALIAFLLAIGAVRLWRHSDDLKAFQDRIQNANGQVNDLRSRLDERARIAARLGDLGDLVAAHQEADNAVRAIAAVSLLADPNDDPRMTLGPGTRFLKRVAASLPFANLTNDDKDVNQAIALLAKSRKTFKAREAIADEASSRVIEAFGKVLAPVGLSFLDVGHSGKSDQPMISAAASGTGRFVAVAPATGNVHLWREDDPRLIGLSWIANAPTLNTASLNGALPKGLITPVDLKVGEASTSRTLSVTFADSAPNRSTIYIRNSRRSFLRYRWNSDKDTWPFPPARLYADEPGLEFLDIAFLQSRADVAVCLARRRSTNLNETIFPNYQQPSLILLSAAIQPGNSLCHPAPQSGTDAFNFDTGLKEADYVRASSTGKFVFIGGPKVTGALFGQLVSPGVMVRVGLVPEPTQILAAAFDREELQLALANSDGQISVYQLSDQPLSTMGNGLQARNTFTTRQGQVTALAFLGANRLVAATGSREIELWDISSGRVEQSLAGLNTPPTFAIAPSENKVIAGGQDGQVLAWQVGDGTPTDSTYDYASRIADLCAKAPMCAGAGLNDNIGASAVVVSPDLEHLALGLESGAILKVDVASGAVEGVYASAALDSNSPVRRLAFSPDATSLASVTDEGTIRVHLLTTGATLVAGTQTRLTGLVFYDNHTLLSTGLDQRRGLFEISQDRSAISSTFLPAAVPRSDDANKQWNSLSIDRSKNTIIATLNAGAVEFTREEWSRDPIPQLLAEKNSIGPSTHKVRVANKFKGILVDGSHDGIQRVSNLEEKTSTLISGRRDPIVHQYWDASGTVVFSMDSANVLRAIDAVHERGLLAIELPASFDEGSARSRKEYKPDLSVVCASDSAPSAHQRCVIAATLGPAQNRISLFTLDMK